MASSDRAWRKLGKTDPYFGVIADDRFRAASLDEHRGEFWKLGEGYVGARLAAAERHFGALARGRALDYGCGVGRLSLPMAGLFEQVMALDVSPAMLDEARRNAGAAGCTNIDFALTDDTLAAAQGHFDFILSCIVFQHIPVKRGMVILRGLLHRTVEGGVFALQICIDRQDTPLQRLRYWAQRYVPGYQIIHNLARGHKAGNPLMQMNAYSLRAIQDLASGLGFGQAVVETQYHGRFLTAEILMRRESLLAG